MENIFRKEALKIMKLHSSKLKGIYEGVKTLEIYNACAKVTVEKIIEETLAEYTNDENHDRVLFYKNVLHELEHLFDTPENCHPENIRQFENES